MGFNLLHNLDYTSQKLRNSLVRHEGRVFKAIDIMPEEKAIALVHPSMPARMVLLKDLDLAPIRLGYCLRNGKAYYISRKPVRGGYKQGLTDRNTSVQCCVVPEARRLSIFDFLGKPIEDTDNGVFTPFQKAIDLAEKGKDSVLSEDFCIRPLNGAVALEYKNSVIGLVEDGAVNLSKKHSYLDKYLEELNVKYTV